MHASNSFQSVASTLKTISLNGSFGKTLLLLEVSFTLPSIFGTHQNGDQPTKARHERKHLELQ
ncbi:MAG: hypothetical protein EB078_02960 [Proteobacteria bacterium]|nr:hypothetical protein [Pseudomonadota bacterium]NDD03843.1 hypothetical protein [Pseudomonadota bacterium]